MTFVLIVKHFGEGSDMKFYIATSLENVKQHHLLRDALIHDGGELTYDWTIHGSVQQEGREIKRKIAEREIKGVLDAELVVVILPGGRGTHVELGAAIVSEKKIIVIGEQISESGVECVFYHYPGVQRIHRTVKDLVEGMSPLL